MRLRHPFAALMFATVVATAAPAAASTMYVATLDGSLECPPVATPATGFGTFVLNDAGTQLTIHIEFSGLLGTQTNQHIHIGAPGTCGGVVFALPAGNPIDVVWNIPAASVQDLNAGLLYVNIHSTFRTAGEIRGQIVAGPTSVAPGTWGRIKTLYR